MLCSFILDMEKTKGLYTGETDLKGNKIYYETSKLKLPDGRLVKLIFETGQLAAYYGTWDGGFVIVEFEGVNNHRSVYLRDCEVVN